MRRKPGTLLLIAAAAVALAACAEEDQPTIVPEPEETAPAPAPEEDVDEAPTEESATPAGATIGDVVRVGDLQNHRARRPPGAIRIGGPGAGHRLPPRRGDDRELGRRRDDDQFPAPDGRAGQRGARLRHHDRGGDRGIARRHGAGRDKVRGEVAFAVPASATGFRFVFDPSSAARRW